MREYRKRKRMMRVSGHASSSSIVCAPERSRVPQRVMERPSPQAVSPNTGFARRARSSFKTDVGTGAVFSCRGPRLPGMPVLP